LGDSEITSLICASDRSLISGSSNGLLKRYNLKKLKSLPEGQAPKHGLEIKLTDDSINCMATICDKYFVVGKSSGTIIKHDSFNLQKEYVYSKVHPGPVNTILLNRTFATGGTDGKVKILQYV